MNKILVRHEKPLVFLGVAVVWAFAYLAVGRWTVGLPAEVLARDAVWFFPIVPAFVAPYLSAFLLPFFAAAALRERAAYRRFARLLVMVMLLSAFVFALWPLALPRPPIGETGALARLLAWLYRVDLPVNLFPSLHVSLSFLFAKAAVTAWPRHRTLFLAWAALIAVSTLFIRQHYLIDVVGGTLVAWVGWRVFVRGQKIPNANRT